MTNTHIQELSCVECRKPVESIDVDMYSVGDRQFEGVMATVRVTDGKLTAQVEKSGSKEYFEDFSKKRRNELLKDVVEEVLRGDAGVNCPNCDDGEIYPKQGGAVELEPNTRTEIPVPPPLTFSKIKLPF